MKKRWNAKRTLLAAALAACFLLLPLCLSAAVESDPAPTPSAGEKEIVQLPTASAPAEVGANEKQEDPAPVAQNDTAADQTPTAGVD